MRKTVFLFFLISITICALAAGTALSDGNKWGGGGGFWGGENDEGRGYGGGGWQGGAENEGGGFRGGGERGFNDGGFVGGTQWGGSGRGLFGQGAKVVPDGLYREECGSCHWVFLPRMLPSQSWEKIMGDLENHFGDDASLDEKDAAAITTYLTQNSSRSFWGRAPLRITEMPRIRRKHWDIPQRVLKRKDIKTLSNCIACHQGAEYGIFGDD